MIPEVEALDTRPAVIRIPSQMDVPVTPRIVRLIDTRAFQRLNRISQLGLVAKVYPGATHSRFEHSLGVYRNALAFVRRLSQFPAFLNQVENSDLEALVVAALLHDVGYWPYCHPIEDIGLATLPQHETVADSILKTDEFSTRLDEDWSCDQGLVSRIIQGNPIDSKETMLCSIMSGPIDIDKMDYLYRDSLHCGVPYGMNFDSPRLINSICLNEAGDGIAISTKGKTAAEMMVFARYVMFSEVYWHHAVRSATAMLQRAFCNATNDDQDFDLPSFAKWDDASFSQWLLSDESNRPAAALFGNQRQLYKRLLDFTADGDPEMYKRIAHQPYQWLQETGQRLATELTSATSETIHPDEILIDAPPTGLEVQFKVTIRDGNGYRQLEEVSPVVKALAQRQFDDFVKRVRIFVHPRLQGKIAPALTDQLLRQHCSG